MQVLTYPKGAAAAVIVPDVQDQYGVAVSDATLRFFLERDGVPVAGAHDIAMAPVEGQPGTYEWVAERTLNLEGTYRWRVEAERGVAFTPSAGLLRVA